MTEKPRTAPKKKPAAKRAPAKGNAAYRGRGSRRARVKTADGLMPERSVIAIFIARMLMAGVIIGGLAVMYFMVSMPDISSIDTIRKQQGITVLSADGRTVANYGDVYGEYIPYEKLPRHLVQAVVATEDRRFFAHGGIDVWGIARAMFVNVRAGHMVQGGSTVTQQVAKNVFLTPDRTLMRKAQEALLALWLEARFSKKEIMAIYLNRVYLGAGTFGIDAAAKRYFNKSAKDLTLEESALLTGLLKAPSRYSPASNSERARARMHQVLVNMEDAGFINKAQVKKSLATYAASPSHKAEGGEVRYFTDWIIEELPKYVGQVEEDMVVTTTLDGELQQKAVDALQTIVSKEGPAKRVSQGAIVAMQSDGAVQAMVGGLSYGESQYNRAAQAKRQPGSVFKLFVYLAALEAGVKPYSTVLDAPVSLYVGNKVWAPENYNEDSYLGEIPMVVALRNSLNTVSVRLGQYAGFGRVANMAERLGIPSVPSHPSIVLGSVEATLLEMTGAYAHLANNGNKVVPYGITLVKTRKGNKELYKHEKAEPESILAQGTVEMMNYMLLDVVARGTGTKARLADRQVAGKTGTSQNFKDAWFIGFTPQMVTGVWVGNDDNKPMRKITGGTIPSAVWKSFMASAMQGKPVLPIPNAASSGEGMLPWLFGNGESGEGESGTEGEISTVDGESGANVLTTPQDMPAGGNGEEGGDGDVLTPQFWNKLMDKAVPDKGDVDVEYSYPGDGRRR